MAQRAVSAFTEDDVKRLSDRFREPEWLRRFRLDSFGRYLELPLELSPLYTKYAGVSRFDPNQFSVRAEEEQVDFRRQFEGHLSGKETDIVLQSNSTTVHVDLQESLVEKGLEVLSIHDAVAKREGLMKDLFETKLASSAGEKYAAFNNAFFNSGTFIRVPAGLDVGDPVRKMLLTNRPNAAVIEQTMILADEGSKLNFLEELYTKSSSGPALVSSVFEVRSSRGAHVDVSSLQMLDESTVYLTNKEVSAADDSRVTSTAILLGSSLTRSRMNLAMNGRGSAVEGFEVFFCGGRQKFDLESNLAHNSPDSSAATHARGVLKDESQSIFKGMIKIRSNAKNSNSYLAHHAMLLDKRARSDGIPGLSIDTNEVKATHSASVAQIDEDQIFYLMTRGLSDDESRKMIVLGFFEPVLARIPVEIAREGAKFILEGKWHGEQRRLLDRESLIALTGEVPVDVKQAEDIFERHYKYRK